MCCSRLLSLDENSSENDEEKRRRRSQAALIQTIHCKCFATYYSFLKDPVLKWLINSKKTEYKTAAIKLSRVTMGN